MGLSNALNPLIFLFTTTAPPDLRPLHQLRASLSAVLLLAIAKKPAYLEEVQSHPSHRQDSVSESVPPPLSKKLTRKKMRKRRRSWQLLQSQRNPNLEALTSPVWRHLQMRRRVKERSRPAPEDSTSLGSTKLQRQRLLQQQRNGHARKCRHLSSAKSDQKF